MSSVYYAYVLLSKKTKRQYTGSCQDLPLRLEYHNRGNVKSTRHGVPWELVYAEEFDTRSDAMNRERYFKTGKGRKELEVLLQSKDHVSLVAEVNRAVAQFG